MESVLYHRVRASITYLVSGAEDPIFLLSLALFRYLQIMTIRIRMTKSKSIDQQVPPYEAV
jgi:hypothetical protein